MRWKPSGPSTAMGSTLVTASSLADRPDGEHGEEQHDDAERAIGQAGDQPFQREVIGRRFVEQILQHHGGGNMGRLPRGRFRRLGRQHSQLIDRHDGITTPEETIALAGRGTGGQLCDGSPRAGRRPDSRRLRRGPSIGKWRRGCKMLGAYAERGRAIRLRSAGRFPGRLMLVSCLSYARRSAAPSRVGLFAGALAGDADLALPARPDAPGATAVRAGVQCRLLLWGRRGGSFAESHCMLLVEVSRFAALPPDLSDQSFKEGADNPANCQRAARQPSRMTAAPTTAPTRAASAARPKSPAR